MNGFIYFKRESNMKIENCIKCKYHAGYENGQVFCHYHRNLDSQATMVRNDEIHVIACPLDESKKSA